MAVHIFRREAIYYWRRRTPRALAPFLDRPHVFMSLQTTSPVNARRLATKLDVVLEDAAMLAENADFQLSKEQINAMLRAVVDRHLTKLERGAAAAKASWGFDVQKARADDRRAFWAYALLDAQGPIAVVRPEDRARMVSEGLSKADIEAVQNHLAMLRANELVPTKRHILERLVEGAKARPGAMNMAQAQSIYFRGMKLALAEVERRYDGDRAEDEGFVDRMLAASGNLQQQISLPPENTADRREASRAENQTVTRTTLPTAEFSKFAEQVIAQNAKDGHWDDKTQRQVRSISDLFVKFMLQDQNVQDLNTLRQYQVGKFVDFLRSEIYVHYGKSAKDAYQSIAEMRKDALSRAKGKQGIGGDTLNRHLTSLGQIIRHAIARGAENFSEIDLGALRSKSKKGRARNARAKLPLDRAAAIFLAPAFNNCADWDSPAEPGPDGQLRIFHGALYFVPILMFYTGCRREELCGAMVDDVVLDNGPIAYIHIVKNKQRRIKNAQSQRNVPLHSEVLRLNFAAYVRAIKALGYELLFPDLYSPSSRSPLGNRFYKQFRPILNVAGITEEGLGSHAVRHLFGAQLKKKLVLEEDRADLLGHGGNSETSERYCEPHEIAMLHEFVQKLPVVTADLQPQDVRLIPWVAEKKVAPFSQPSRAKRGVDQG